MDLDFVPASPGGSRFMDESAGRQRQRQRRLSTPSVRTYLTPAFDAVAAGEGGGASGYSSSPSSGGLDLGFDASLLRYRRACFAANADLDSRLLLYSPQSAPPPPPQGRAAYQAADDGVWVAGGGRYVSKREAGGLTGAPGFQDFISPWQTKAELPTSARGSSNSMKLPADFRFQEGATLAAKTELLTPKPSAKATSAEPEPTKEDDDRITQALYGHSGHRRLPIFRDICPE
ncbi:hypothetical protein ACP4OV_028236 [Aristida adscensionis]